MALTKTYKRAEDIVVRRIAGETLLIPISGTLAGMQCIFALNPVGELIWDNLDGRRDVERLCDVVTAAFSVEVERARADVLEFIEQLRAAELISEVV
jgi:hypothetical protein